MSREELPCLVERIVAIGCATFYAPCLRLFFTRMPGDGVGRMSMGWLGCDVWVRG